MDFMKEEAALEYSVWCDCETHAKSVMLSLLGTKAPNTWGAFQMPLLQKRIQENFKHLI
jgi:hypothetical protein